MENAFVIIIIYVDDVLLGATDNHLSDTVVKEIVNQLDWRSCQYLLEHHYHEAGTTTNSTIVWIPTIEILYGAGG